MMDKLEKAKQKGDLISREWLEDAFDNLCCHNCKICRNFRIEDSFYKCALIDNAPTVEPFEPDYVGAERLKARQRGYETGYQYGMKIGKTLNPKIEQGEWIEVTQRISDSETSTHWECSICREPDRKYGKSKFCCECGAKMKKTQTQKFADDDTAYGGLASAT